MYPLYSRVIFRSNKRPENVNEQKSKKNNIATIYLKVKLDPKEDDATARFKEIRDAAVTRINIQF